MNEGDILQMEAFEVLIQFENMKNVSYMSSVKYLYCVYEHMCWSNASAKTDTNVRDSESDASDSGTVTRFRPDSTFKERGARAV